MTKIDIFSGFLGAGKTTLIKKLINEAYKGEKVVLIENEFGEIGIDGGFLKEAGIEITEMNSGCICCSLVGDFGEALKKVLSEYNPDRIVIEPSGVGKLSDVIRAVEDVLSDDVVINGFTTVADATKCKIYIKNFGEFYNDQIKHAGCIVLSHTGKITEDKIKAVVELLREHNKDAIIVTTPWEELTGNQLLEAMERKNTLENILNELTSEEEICPECGHHHEHHDCCDHDHEHHHEHHDCCDHDHEHHHEHHDCCDHDHDRHHEHHDCCDHDHEHHHEHHDCCDHDHEHHHEHHDCCGHDHEHHHEHHHHADEVFTSFGRETTKKFDKSEIENILKELENKEKYGFVLRSKGIVAGKDDSWIHFDYVPGEPDVRDGSADVIGRICVIGSEINEVNLSELFGI